MNHETLFEKDWEKQIPAGPSVFEFLRKETVGANATITTPFGHRSLVYADYTASGRFLDFVEVRIRKLQCFYGNTHSEDDTTGRASTTLLAAAEKIIKKSVNAGPRHRLIACGDGATAAIYRLQQILGVALPPRTWTNLDHQLRVLLSLDNYTLFSEQLEKLRPIVFVGPYEHHSNEISWRNGFASVIEVDLTEDGGIDINHLTRLLEDPLYRDRLRIGSFSAASNVTGRLTPVHEIAGILHRHDAIACFDFAASAPYVKIDMNPEPDATGEDKSLDAVFISPHKFLGGPSSSGILVFNERIYSKTMAPSIAGGGTVAYVNNHDEDFYPDIEEREKAGTPGIFQTVRAAMAFLVKDVVGVDRIEAREAQLLMVALKQWLRQPAIQVLGNLDPDKRIAIVSFNIKVNEHQYLHPRFVTTLLNDLFGIQSRAGCACAGPYGHRLLGIDRKTSEKYRHAIQLGLEGVKPGWCRIGFHYTMDDPEVKYVIKAVEFVAALGHLFLSQYNFDLKSGTWTHKRYRAAEHTEPLGRSFCGASIGSVFLSRLPRNLRYQFYLGRARAIARELRQIDMGKEQALPEEVEQLRFFALYGTNYG